MKPYERVKYIRKDILKISQEDFSKKLNISRSNLGSIEIGRIKLTDRVLIDICREYNVNLHWLQTGEGEAFDEPFSESELDDLVNTILAKKDPFVVNTFKAFARLDPAAWEVIHQLALDMCHDDFQIDNNKS